MPLFRLTLATHVQTLYLYNFPLLQINDFILMNKISAKLRPVNFFAGHKHQELSSFNDWLVLCLSFDWKLFLNFSCLPSPRWKKGRGAELSKLLYMMCTPRLLLQELTSQNPIARHSLNIRGFFLEFTGASPILTLAKIGFHWVNALVS